MAAREDTVRKTFLGAKRNLENAKQSIFEASYRIVYAVESILDIDD